MAEPEKSFTGVRRKRETRWAVKMADRVSTFFITAGGIGTIVAVSLVCVFLVWTAVPLFQSAQVSQAVQVRRAWSADDQPLKVGLDEYRTMGWALMPDGMVRVFRADTGEQIHAQEIFAGQKITSFSFPIGSETAIFGFDDGHVRVARLGFKTTFLNASEFDNRPEIAAQLRDLIPGDLLRSEEAVLQLTPQGQLRQQQFFSEVQAEFKVAEAAITGVDYADGPQRILTQQQDGTTRIHALAAKRNFLSGKTTVALGKSYDLPLQTRNTPGKYVLISALGDRVYVGWEDGLVQRFDTRNLSTIAWAEDIDLAPGDAQLTVLTFLLGRITLVAGDDQGVTRCVFPVRAPSNDDGYRESAEQSANAAEDSATNQGVHLVIAHTLPGPAAAVSAVGVSTRNRNLAVGYADGGLRVFYVTNDNLLLNEQITPGEPVQEVLFTPKEDGLAALTPSGLWMASFDARHPEVTRSLSSVFLPVWYENYATPQHVWQSGGGSTDLEAKLGMWPLVFGTLKATFYAMLFGAPLALLAAIYTSEFLHRSTKARIKPTIEVMASLPSVVLGFLAAIVFAPFVSQLVPGILSSFAMVPLSLIVAAFLWQLLPYTVQIKWHRAKFTLMFLTVGIGLAASVLVGPLVESWLFAGNVKTWLLGHQGSPVGGWMILLLPLTAIFWAVVSGRRLTPWLRDASRNWTRERFAVANFGKLLLVLVSTLATAWLVSTALSWKWDPRGNYVGKYDDRNALIVGFVMGFAIIPIIYTIAEDALSTVPDHLRSASLGAGATRWQTVTRIIIPTAMSGLFSAVMIGLGRAVGETMIVLMAGGNTPIPDLNIFNGFRTLSANIATELPEAVPGGTIYRTLFLAGLTLFAMTFVVNTIAEVVRLRFRRRAYQL